MNKIKSVIMAAAGLVLFAGTILKAQSIPTITGTPITYQGQTFLLTETTNAQGQVSYNVYTYGVSGTNTVMVPATLDQAGAVVQQLFQQNNPADIGFYPTNGQAEWEARLGAAYVQNTGQAAASLSVDYYGLFDQAWLGVGGGILQANSTVSSQSGTAGAWAEAVYRKPIGNVAGVIGPIAGYDVWNHKVFGGAKVGLEYRENKNLGEYVDVEYAFESGKSSRGLLVSGGISYAFQ
jgi:hypothetical protein